MTERAAAMSTDTTTEPRARRTTAKRKRSRGQILVIFAGAIFLMMMLMAVVIDVSWYWVNSLRAQRAADAAALAGAVMLPQQVGSAYTLARQEATKNGFTQGVNGVTEVFPQQDGGNPRRLNVRIQAQIGTFFMRVIGIPQIRVIRNSTAEFTPPVPMGSPQNYYGVGILNLPTTSQVAHADDNTDWRDSSSQPNDRVELIGRSGEQQQRQLVTRRRAPTSTCSSWLTTSACRAERRDPERQRPSCSMGSRSSSATNSRAAGTQHVLAELRLGGHLEQLRERHLRPTVGPYPEPQHESRRSGRFGANNELCRLRAYHVWTRNDFAMAASAVRLTYLKPSCGGNRSVGGGHARGPRHLSHDRRRSRTRRRRSPSAARTVACSPRRSSGARCRARARRASRATRT